MLAEDIKRKLNVNCSVNFTKMERAYLLKIMGRVIDHTKSNAKYYQIDESMINIKARWTDDDVQYLIDAYNRGETDKDIAEALSRSLKGVERKRDRLGLKHY